MSVCLLSLFYVCFFFLFIFSRFCNILLFVLQCNNFFFILNFVLCISFFSGPYFCLCLLATPPDTPFRHILLSICEKVAWARIFLNACQLLFRRVVLFWCAAVVVAVVLLFFFARSYVALGFSINTTFLRAFFLISSYLSSSHSDLLYSFVFFLHIMLSVYFMHSFLLPPPLLLLYVSSKLYEFISIVRFSIIRRRVVLFSSGYAKYWKCKQLVRKLREKNWKKP